VASALGAASLDATPAVEGQKKTDDGATTEDPQPSPSASAESFSWTKAWYPLSPVSLLDPDEPAAQRLLGKELVVWKDSRGEWHAVEDSCPHRMAPLSLGFLNADKTALTCRYHGWEFDGSGACTRIPWSVDAKAEETACGSASSRAASYPTRVIAGLLWVWPEAGPEAFVESAMAPTPTAGADRLPGEWSLVELPVGYVPALENQFDPTHAEWLHCAYGEDGQAVQKSAPVPMDRFTVRDGAIGGKSGFVVEHGGYNAQNISIQGERKFTPPCSSRTEYLTAQGEPLLSAQIYYTPTEPGRVRMHTKYLPHKAAMVFSAPTPVDRLAQLKEAPLQWFVNSVVPTLPQGELIQTGLVHGLNKREYLIRDQDVAAMHGVEVAMDRYGKGWKKSYYLPAPADVGVNAFRTWLDRHAGGGVQWAPEAGAEAAKGRTLPEDERYDRLSKHTIHCRSCRAALRALGEWEEQARKGAGVFFVFGLVFALTGAAGGHAIDNFASLASLSVAGLLNLATGTLQDAQHSFISSVPRRGVPKVQLWDTRSKSNRGPIQID